jgi:hypothetical protein
LRQQSEPIELFRHDQELYAHTGVGGRLSEPAAFSTDIPQMICSGRHPTTYRRG